MKEGIHLSKNDKVVRSGWITGQTDIELKNGLPTILSTSGGRVVPSVATG